MRAARMSKRQASPATSAVLVDSFTPRPLAGKVSGTLPEVPQLSANAPLARFTVSLNTTSRSAAAGKVLLPCAGVVVDTDGGVFGPGVPPPLKVWPLLQLPKVWPADSAQVKWVYWLPLPVSCNEVPGAVLLVSATGMFWLVMPAAGPPEAVMAPS